MTVARMVACFGFSLALCIAPALAQTPEGSPAPSPTPQSAATWHNPEGTPYSIVDPCGGPKELLAKINPSPCVLVLGQAQISFGYANVNTHGTISAVGPFQRGALLPISGNANAYPTLLLAFGVSPSAQLQISLPSTVAISTQRLGSVNATTDPSFNYKQLLYFSPTKFTLFAVQVGYTAPTGDGSLGPSYAIQPQLTQPFNANVSAGVFWTFKNASVSNGGMAQRAWSDPLGAYVAWSPPSSPLALLPLVTHEFNPNRTTLVFDAMYLLNRRTLLNVSYGGLGISSSTVLPAAPNFTFAANVNPRIFVANLYFLVGHESNLPPMPPPAAATPATPAP